MRRTAVRSTIPLAAGAAVLALAGPASAGQGAAVARLSSGGPAYTYVTALAAEGSQAVVTSVATADGRTIVTLRMQGLVPDRTYGAHAHYLPCGASGGAAGAHYQHSPDTSLAGSLTSPSSDPTFANPANEIWLDLHTNAAGNAVGRAVVDWHVDGPGAHSVVIHRDPTSPGGTLPAGSAGPRLACIPFSF